MAGKSVTVSIAPQDQIDLKKNGYNLCFAKLVNGVANVVWQSQGPDEWIAMNTFSWDPVYQVYGAQAFQSSVQVKEATNAVSAQLGDTTVLNQYGIFDPASQAGPSTAVTIDNQFRLITMGMNQLAGGTSTPIYVSPEQAETGVVTLTPVDQIMVWFDQELTTSTMFSSARSNTTKVDLTTTDSASILYSGGIWINPAPASAVAGLGDPKTILTLVFGVAAAVTVSQVASKIASYLTGVYATVKVDVKYNNNQLTVNYTEAPSLDLAGKGISQALLGSNVTKDTLLQFAGKALASLNIGFTTLSGQ
jgi:hypothetical protein